MKLKVSILALGLISGSAFASKARMAGLNQDDVRGSFYLNDNRNVFRYANAINDMSSYVITEYGTSSANGSGGSAEGGFFSQASGLNYGLYINSAAYGNVPGIDHDGNAGTANLDPNRVDIIVGSSSNLDWGFRLGYASVQSGDNNDGSGLDLSLAANVAGADVWVNYTPATTIKVTGTETEYAADMSFGAGYKMGEYTLFGEYQSEGFTEGSEAGTVLTAGVAQVVEKDGYKIITDLSVVSSSNYDADGTTFAEGDSALRMPVTLAFESSVNSWLQVRGSIQQSIFGSHTDSSNNDSETSGRTTKVAAGASLFYEAIQIDGTFASVSGTNFGLGTNFLTNVSATYRF